MNDEQKRIIIKTRDIARSIETHLLEYDKLKYQTHYTPEYLADLRMKLRAQFLEKLSNELNTLIYQVRQYSKELNIQKEKLERVYTPDSKEDELLYYERKREFLESLSRYSPDKIISMYEDYVRLGNNEKTQFYEDSGYNLLSKMDTGRAQKFETLVSLNKRQRTESLSEEYDKLREFESLERTAQRILSGYSHGDFIDIDAYVFYSLASKLENTERKIDARQFKQLATVEI